MKIYAVENISTKKNNKIQAKNQSFGSITSKFQTNYDSLEINNNVSFKGGKTALIEKKLQEFLTKKGNKFNKNILYALIGLMTTIGVSSCINPLYIDEYLEEIKEGDEKKTEINIEINQENDYSAFITWLENYSKQNQLNWDSILVLQSQALELMTQLNNNQIEALEYLKEMTELKKELIKEVTKGNEQRAQILARIEEIEDLYEKAIISNEAYFKLINDQLEKLSGKLDKISNSFNTLLDIANKSLEQDIISNKKADEMKKMFSKFYNDYTKDEKQEELFYMNVFNYLVLDDLNQKIIINLLIENGKTQTEANKILNSILDEVEAGNITAEEAFNTITSQLGNINVSLDEIKAELNKISNELASIKDMIATQDSMYTNINTIVEQGKFNNKALVEIKDYNASINDKLANIEINTKDMIAIIKDSTKFDALIKAIEEIEVGSVDYNKFEEMFETLGIKLSEVVDMSADQLEAALKTFMDNELAMDKEEQKILNEILTKIDNIKQQPIADLTSLENAIKDLKAAYLAGNKDVLGALNNIEKEVIDLHNTLKNFYNDFGAFADQTTTYLEIYKKQNDKTIELLLSGNSTLEELKDEQNLTNKKLDALLTKADSIDVKMQYLIDNGHGDITMAELTKLIKEYGEDNVKNLRALFIELGLDKINENTNNIEDYQYLILEAIKDIKGECAQINNILALIEAKNIGPDQLKVIITEVLKNHECNCNCTGSGNHEGILDDLENKLNGLI